ncbi:uncharacterized protein [Procambarus clarkii]|uniref:uncharacterized protein isoform X2 n=1 Tax=Procambarus clarkii TaxID=6728 RepID=UPI003743D48F
MAITNRHNYSPLPKFVMSTTTTRGLSSATVWLFLTVLTWTPALIVGVMSSEHPLVPWEDMWEEAEEMTQKYGCPSDNALCGSNNTRSTDILSDIQNICKPCWCDDACQVYGDCCRDKAEADWGDGHDENNGHYSCLAISTTGMTGLMMMDSCPPEYANQPVELLCTRKVPPESYSYVLDMPVTSRLTNTTYVNYHCAICNNDAEDLHTWNVTIKCNTKQIAKEYSMEEFMKKAQYQAGMRQWRHYTYRSHEDQQRNIPHKTFNCFFEISEFKNPTLFAENYGGRLCPYPRNRCDKKFVGKRQCIEQVRDCDPAWPNHLDRVKCHRYSHFLQYKDADGHVTVFKNPHCARCNFKNVSSNALTCVPLQKYNKCASKRGYSPPPLPLCFSVLMDFSKDICNNVDELWDPIHLTCKKIYCGGLYKLENGECVRDSTAYRSLGNSTLLDQSCPKIMLSENEFIPQNDGTVFVNASKKVYQKSEFEMFNKTKILICNAHFQYIGGFTNIHELLTLIVLLISLTGLALHIVIYLLVPRYRNLPGKNLFSLSCCLFTTHFIFLTGMRATDNYGLCIFISATFHYFWLASFCWMNVMSVDVCRTFTSQLYRGSLDASRTYIFYSIYAWSIPALVVTLSFVFDHIDILPDYKPRYATNICWISNRYGLALFFLLPVGAIILENTVLFFVTACEIYKQAKAAKYANTRSQSVKESHVLQETKQNGGKLQKHGVLKHMPQGRRRTKERVRLILYVKLGVIQGLSWVTGLVAAFADIPAFWYPFTIFNGLQGAFIFLGFDLKSKVGEAMWDVLFKKPWRDYRSSKDTRTTSGGRSNSSQNQSSKSYSDSDEEDRTDQSVRGDMGAAPRAVEGVQCGSTTGLTQPMHTSAKASSQQSSSHKTSACRRGTKDFMQDPSKFKNFQPSSLGQTQDSKNGDMQGSGVKSKFEDETAEDAVRGECFTTLKSANHEAKKEQIEKQNNKLDLQNVMDLLQQSKNSVDLPDLVQQLLLQSGGSVDDNEQRPSPFTKCKSFSEGTNPVLQEEQCMALDARLKLLEYSKECPGIHSLIISHAHTAFPEARQVSNVSTGPGTVSKANDYHHIGLPSLTSFPLTQQCKQPKSLVNTVNNFGDACSCSTCKHHLSQLLNEEEFSQNQEKKEQAQGSGNLLQRRPKSLSFSQISHVSLAAAIMQRASLDAQKKQHFSEEDTRAHVWDDTRKLLAKLSKKVKVSESLV